MSTYRYVESKVDVLNLMVGVEGHPTMMRLSTGHLMTGFHGWPMRA